ncbi:MAG: TrkA family potassium uptake protein [Lachnospiraceae bacterium]|nr:TrkA family potassium uptake protein [Lachnospiraceae bacterium]
MRTFLIIGMGTFGHHLCKEILEQKAEVMVVDNDEACLEDVLHLGVSAKIADCTNKEALESFDIPSFDCCFVCLGGNFQSSLQATDLLKELGAKKIYSKAESDIQAKFLSRAGADYIIYPEQEVAKRIAVSEHSDKIFDFIKLGDDFSIYEIEVNDKWVGKTVMQVNVRANYNLNIIGTKKDEIVRPMPGPDYKFTKKERLLVIGRAKDVERVIK